MDTCVCGKPWPCSQIIKSTHCSNCKIDIPYFTWVSDVCPLGYRTASGRRIAGAECPIFECESFRTDPTPAQPDALDQLIAGTNEMLEFAKMFIAPPEVLKPLMEAVEARTDGQVDTMTCPPRPLLSNSGGFPPKISKDLESR